MQRHYPLNPATGVEDTSAIWTNGVPQTGTQGSFPPYQLCTNPQDEILNVIVSAGITPSDTDLGQLNDAIQDKIDAAIATVHIPTVSATEGVKDVAGVVSLNYPGLAANTITDTDLIAFYSESGGHHDTTTGSALATYILNKSTGTTPIFVKAADPLSFATFALAARQAVPDLTNTIMNVQTSAGGNPPWGTCSNGVVTITTAGLYAVQAYAQMDVNCGNEAAYFQLLISHNGSYIADQSGYGNAYYYLGIAISVTAIQFANVGDTFAMLGSSHAANYDSTGNHFNPPCVLTIGKIN
jgi:hypothetical protein